MVVIFISLRIKTIQFYTQVLTSNLKSRLYQHRNSEFKNTFTNRYNVKKLVYFEEFNNIEKAIVREKQIKAGYCQKQIDLVNRFNPEWKAQTFLFI